MIRNVFWILFILELSLLIWWTIDQRHNTIREIRISFGGLFGWWYPYCVKVFRLRAIGIDHGLDSGYSILAYLVFLLAVMIIALFQGRFDGIKKGHLPEDRLNKQSRENGFEPTTC